MIYDEATLPTVLPSVHSTLHSRPSTIADDDAPAEAAPSLAAVSLKLPPFWPADPDVWIAQVEAQFTTKRITSQQTMFDYIVSSLNLEFAAEVRDLLLRTPPTTPMPRSRPSLSKGLQPQHTGNCSNLSLEKSWGIVSLHNSSDGCSNSSETN